MRQLFLIRSASAAAIGMVAGRLIIGKLSLTGFTAVLAELQEVINKLKHIRNRKRENEIL